MITTTRPAADLTRDWAVVARQPLDTMRWEWIVDARTLHRALDNGTAESRQRRDAGEFVLLARLRVGRK